MSLTLAFCWCGVTSLHVMPILWWIRLGGSLLCLSLCGALEFILQINPENPIESERTVTLQSTYWIKTRMTKFQSMRNVINPLCAILFPMCVCKCGCVCGSPTSRIACCKLYETEYSCLPVRLWVQLTLIIPTYLPEDESTLLWFKTLCTPWQRAACSEPPHLPPICLNRNQICIKKKRKKTLCLHCYSKHKIIHRLLWPQMSGGRERKKNKRVGGMIDDFTPSGFEIHVLCNR